LWRNRQNTAVLGISTRPGAGILRARLRIEDAEQHSRATRGEIRGVHPIPAVVGEKM
jgi:hypothetical protein